MDVFADRYASFASGDDMIYVLDANLRLVWTNPAWGTFARRNNGEALLARGLGENVLDMFCGGPHERWRGIYEQLCAKRLPMHAETVICPSPRVRRTLQLIITPLYDEQGRVARLVHRTHLLSEREAVGDAAPEDEYRDMTAQGVSTCHMRRSLEMECGDMTWARNLDDGKRVLVLADVMGHGEHAAQVALMLANALEDAPPAGPAETVRVVNNSLCRQEAAKGLDMIFATGYYLEIDAAKGGMNLCNFGHPPLVGSRIGSYKPPSGLPVGMFSSEDEWPAVQTKLVDIGNRMLLFTDGVIEQFNSRGEMFGMERLVQVFMDGRRESLQNSMIAVMRALDTYRGDAIIKDDITLMGIEMPAAA